MHGYPSSGKSTLAAKIKNKLGYTLIKSVETRFSGAKVKFSVDDIDESIPETRASKDMSYWKMVELGEEGITQGKDVILDATFHRFYRRKWVYDLAKRLNLSPIIIWVTYKEDPKVFEERRNNPDFKDNILDSYEQYEKMVSQTDGLKDAELDRKYADTRIIKYDRNDNTVTLVNCEEDPEIEVISSAILSEGK